MTDGSCHGGPVRWTLLELPEPATACNCTACRRYGVLWADGYEGESITVSGEATPYVRGNSLSFKFCPRCGGVTHWRVLHPNAEGRRRIAVNLRMREPGLIAPLPIDHFDGLDTRQVATLELWIAQPDWLH
jgi:hypothetical protein